MPSENFVNVPVESDSSTLAETTKSDLRLSWPGWREDKADLEVVLIETLSPLAQNAAEVAGQVPFSVVITIGEKLYGEPYHPGTPAVGTVRFYVATDAVNIPAFTEVDIDGYAFATGPDDAGVVTPGDTYIDLEVTSMVFTELANGLPGVDVSLLTSPSGVSSPELQGTTSNGSDPEDEDSYGDKIIRLFRLRGRTLVLSTDYELLALNFPTVGRALGVSDKVNRHMYLYVATTEGEVVATSVKDAIAAEAEIYRNSTWLFTVDDPTYATISVTYTVKSYLGFNSADLILRCNEALSIYLDPSNFGKPSIGDQNITDSVQWVNDTKVRKNKIVEVLGSVEGVHYVASVTLGPSPDVNGDVALSGNAPLTRAGTLTGTVV